MEEIIEGFSYGGTDYAILQGFKGNDKKKEGEQNYEGYPGYAGAPYGYVPAPGYVPVAPTEGAVPGVPPGYVPAPPTEGAVPGVPPGYVPAPGYYPPPPGYILENHGEGEPAKHHAEKAKEEAIVELRKKKSGSQRLTEKILSWMPVAPTEGAVPGVPPGYVPPPGNILENHGEGEPAKHHAEKAKEEAIVELRKKRSGSQRLTEKILSWMPEMPKF